MSASSRKKRILDLALQMDKHFCSDPTLIKNNNEEHNNIESAFERDSHTSPPLPSEAQNIIVDMAEACERDSHTSSPLPLEAQNIFVEMAEVYHDVFNDTNHTAASELQLDASKNKAHATCQQVVTTLNTKTTVSQERQEIIENITSASCQQVASPPVPIIQDAHPEEELTPLNIEVTSSLNNSPAVYLEEFEEPLVATPSASHITLATPLPSPINVHKNCDDHFCPDHSSWIDSIQSATDVPTLTSTQRKKRRSKKRSVNKNNWSDVKRKCLRNLGKSDVSKRGKFVEDKVMGKPCSCRYKCAEKITQDQRLECFTRFWKLGSPEKQWRFVAKYVTKVPKYRCLNRKTPNKRQYTLKYILPIKSSNADATTINVCKTMFLKALAVSESIIKTAFKKYDGVTDFEEDKRGKHDHHKSVITNEMIKSVCDHVNSFVPVESYFIRKDSTKLYLDGSLSISQMYKLYNEWFDQNVYSSKATTERQYRDIVNTNFNLGFHIPKKDQCEVCHIFRNNPTPTNEEIQKNETHKKAKKTAREMKEKDKRDAIESKGSIVTAVFDFQKVLTCPHGQISILYYKRKLSAFNFTVYNLGQKKAVCYMWDETVAKQGANEVGSCLLDYIKDNSDNCAGQNRNRFVFFVYLFAAKKYKVSITHRFLEKGHIQNEGDIVHALIERSSYSKMIYTPDEWRLLVRWAKTEGAPYFVKNMKQENFFNFKIHVNDKQWNKNFRKQKIQWTKVKEVFVDRSEPNKLYFKYDLNEESYECLVLRNDTRNSSITPVLERAYTSPLKLTKAKYNDLESMCKTGVINANNAVFFRSLPYKSNNANDDDDLSDKTEWVTYFFSIRETQGGEI